MDAGTDAVTLLQVKEQAGDVEQVQLLKMYSVGTGDQRNSVPDVLSREIVSMFLYRTEGTRRPPSHVLDVIERGDFIKDLK